MIAFSWNDVINLTIYGGAGNNAYVKAYADGGDDNDLFVPVENATVTLTGGDGNDTFWFIESSTASISGGAGKNLYRFDPYYLFGPYQNDVIITDISSNDTIRYDYEFSDTTELSWSKDSKGNIVLKDTGFRNFNITLQGITDLSQVADVTYRSVNETKTLGEIFNISNGEDDNGNDTMNIGNGTTGNDSLSNDKNGMIVNGNGGNDTISNRGDNVTINAGNGSNKIYNDGASVKIDCGNNGDYVSNFGGELNPGENRTNNGDNVTINGGSGDDTILNEDGDNVLINGGYGNDSIAGYIETSRITINGGNGNDTITGTYFSSVIDSGADKDKINVFASRSTILGGSDNDEITFAGGYLLVNAGDGNDSILYRGNCYSDVTIDTGIGDNTVKVEGTYSDILIKTGNGNDNVQLNGSVGGCSNPGVTTVESSAGFDTIYGEQNSTIGTFYKFDAQKGGCTIVYNVKGKDTISIVGESYEKFTIAGSNDVTLIAGEGSMILKDAKNVNLTIDGLLDIKPVDPPTPTVTPQDVIKNMATELSNITDDIGIKQLDRAINSATGSYYKDAQAVIDDMVKTRAKY